ncbi:MAG: rod shape-determining protein MreD [Stagnimonas sp.]|nr:rod shape-determining protein MreD [Stagnimonas sp.]
MSNAYTRGLFALSLLVAFTLQIIALPDAVSAMRPMWVVVLIGYWSFYGPNLPMTLIAFLTGLACDVLYNTPLGQHGLGLLLVAYALTRLRSNLGLFPLWQQTLALMPAWFLYALLQFWLDGMARHAAEASLRFLPVIPTIFCWPLLCSALDALRGPGGRV